MKQLMKSFVRPPSLANLVANQLREEIIDGTLGFGEALSEVTIAKRLEVSRTPVREAFARLELEGLVHSAPQRGTFVFSVTRDQLQAICDARVVLETGALRLAVVQGRRDLVKRLGAVVGKMERALQNKDTRGYLALDAAFHQALIDGAANAFLGEAYQTIAPRMSALRTRLGDHPSQVEKSFQEHRQIAQDIADGNDDHAEQTLIAHIGQKEGSYWSL